MTTNPSDQSEEDVFAELIRSFGEAFMAGMTPEQQQAYVDALERHYREQGVLDE